MLLQPYAVAWMLSQTTTDPAVWLQPLGAFAAAALVGAWFIRDKIRENTRLLDAVEKQSATLIEIRDTMRAALSTIESSTKAMNSMSEAIKRSPSETETVRLRILLEELEQSRQRTTPRRGSG
jgi:hypothetical protein